jgi:hypothetical protein
MRETSMGLKIIPSALPSGLYFLQIFLDFQKHKISKILALERRAIENI